MHACVCVCEFSHGVFFRSLCLAKPSYAHMFLVHVCVCTYTYMCIYIYTYIHKCMHIHVHENHYFPTQVEIFVILVVLVVREKPYQGKYFFLQFLDESCVNPNTF